MLMLLLSEAWRLILSLQAALKLTPTIYNSLKSDLGTFGIFELFIPIYCLATDPGYLIFELLILGYLNF